MDRIGDGVNDPVPADHLRLLGHYQALVVLDGELELLSRAAGSCVVGTDDAIVILPDEPAMYFPMRRTHTRWIVWHGPEADTLAGLGYLSPSAPVIRDAGHIVKAAYSAAAKTLSREDIASVLERKGVLLTLILDLYRAGLSTTTAGVTASVGEHAVAYIADHLTRDVTIDEIAAACNVSPTHFRRLFKAHTGRSPRQFITAMRISKAKEALAAGYPIKRAAASAGFGDVSYFMRTFRQVAGLTAGEFAAQNRQ